MAGEDKRRSERVIPFVSDEEVVVIRLDDGKTVLGKMLDLSEVGTLIYLIADSDLPGEAGLSCALSMYHEKKVFDVPARLSRKSGRLMAFDFENGLAEALHDIQTKLIRMEIEWMRLSRRG
jgi:hypothetical protein